jgi:predicted DNA-binding protein (MmcQ/YjbR family)
MSKRHWNTVTLDGTLSDDLVREMIEHSYELVVSSLPKRTRELLDKSKS